MQYGVTKYLPKQEILYIETVKSSKLNKLSLANKELVISKIGSDSFTTLSLLIYAHPIIFLHPLIKVVI